MPSIRLPVFPEMLRFPVELPLRGLALIGLCALYLLAGLFGHDPWKSDDAIHFGVAYGFLNGDGLQGGWLVPHLAGEPFLEAPPPLYYWVAAACAKLLGWLLTPPDATRLASALFGAAFLGLLAAASRVLYANSSSNRDIVSEEGNVAPLIAIGCLGLLVPIHDTQPLIALLAASAATYLGLAVLPQRPLAGGIQAGLGLGLGFLAAGSIAVITLAPLLLLAPLHRHWRSSASLRGIALALLVAAPLIAIWPIMLAWQAPHFFSAWWSHSANSLVFQTGWRQSLLPLAELMGWFTWPALPLALYTLWIQRHRLNQPGIVLPLIGLAALLLELVFIFGPRPLFALPLLLPLILLATVGAGRLRRGAANAFDWFGMMTLTLVAGLLWLGGSALTLGIPTRLAVRATVLEPGFVSTFSPLPFIIAVALLLAWLWFIFASPRSPWRATTHWAAGVTLMWALVATLWLPWIDYGKSYRNVVLDLKRVISSSHGCIAGHDIGGAQRLSLQYFAGIVTVRTNTRTATTCPLLLEQGAVRGATSLPPPGWRKIWEGHRPSDRSERLRLFQRNSD